MKTVYVCEKCGAKFEKCGDCYDCESSHLDNLDWSSAREMIPEGAYKPGQQLASTVNLTFRTWGEGGGEVLVVAQYKLVKELQEESAARTAARREENERSRREWEERKAAQEAAQAAAEEAATEEVPA